MNFPHTLGGMSPTPRSYLVPFSEYYCMQRPFPLYWTPVLRQRSRAPYQILIQAPVKKARAKKRVSGLMGLKTYLVDNNVCFGHSSWFLSSHECHDIGLGVKFCYMERCQYLRLLECHIILLPVFIIQRIIISIIKLTWSYVRALQSPSIPHAALALVKQVRTSRDAGPTAASFFASAATSVAFMHSAALDAMISVSIGICIHTKISKLRTA